MQNKYNIIKNDDEKFNFVLLDKSDIPQIKNLFYLIWNKGGEFPDRFYNVTLEQNLSYAYKIKDEIIAVCLVGERKSKIYINAFCVKKEYRRKGIGEALFNYCIEKCKNFGFNCFYLHVAQSNIAAINLYKKFGFKTEKELLDYYIHDVPPDRDAYLMSLDTSDNTNTTEFINYNDNVKIKKKIKKKKSCCNFF